MSYPQKLPELQKPVFPPPGRRKSLSDSDSDSPKTVAKYVQNKKSTSKERVENVQGNPRIRNAIESLEYTKLDSEEICFADTLGKIERNEVTAIKILKGTDFNQTQKEQLHDITKKKNITIVKECCRAGDMSGYAALSPEGKYVVVNYSSHGRTQHVTVIDDYVYENDQGLKEKKEEANKEEANKEANKEDEVNEDEVNEYNITSDLNTDSDLNKVLELTRKKSTDREYEDMEPWKQFISLTFVNYKRKITVKEEKNDFNGENDAFFTLHIEIHATNRPAHKWIKFKLTDAVGMKSIMGSDEEKRRGFFNHSASVYIFPGSGEDHTKSQLPLGWCRPYMEPRTTKSEATYTCTTGWSVGTSADANFSATGGVKVGINASYNQSKQMQCTIPDFKIRNISDSSMTGWNYYYTAVDGVKWKEHSKGGINPISDLARSTLTLNAECLYEGPHDYDEDMEWNFEFVPKFALLYKKQEPVIHTKRFQVKTHINMKIVNTSFLDVKEK